MGAEIVQGKNRLKDERRQICCIPGPEETCARVAVKWAEWSLAPRGLSQGTWWGGFGGLEKGKHCACLWEGGEWESGESETDQLYSSSQEDTTKNYQTINL